MKKRLTNTSKRADVSGEETLSPRQWAELLGITKRAFNMHKVVAVGRRSSGTGFERVVRFCDLPEKFQRRLRERRAQSAPSLPFSSLLSNKAVSLEESQGREASSATRVALGRHAVATFVVTLRFNISADISVDKKIAKPPRHSAPAHEKRARGFAGNRNGILRGGTDGA
ncbi:MAG TPA: hypothetical protein VGG02_13860 [Chthoniobacterales bacterium]|jgi:hypothetical protein